MRSWRKAARVLPSTIPEIELGRGEIEKQITERTRQKISDFGIELLDERFKRSKYNPAVAEKIIERMSSETAPDRCPVSFRGTRRGREHQRPKGKRRRLNQFHRNEECARN